jgi:type IV secretory pathway TrbL component
VIAVAIVSYYPLGAQVMTLVLPLGWFIVVMIGMYIVFTRPHTVPGHQAIAGARPVAPAAEAAAPTAAATGFPTATSSAGTEPLADRATPPAVGAASKDAGPDASLPGDASDTAASGAGEADQPDSPEESE